MEGRGKEMANLSNYDLVAKLETMVAAQHKHKEERRCLEASSKQLELGVKTGVEDVLTFNSIHRHLIEFSSYVDKFASIQISRDYYSLIMCAYIRMRTRDHTIQARAHARDCDRIAHIDRECSVV